MTDPQPPVPPVPTPDGVTPPPPPAPPAAPPAPPSAPPAAPYAQPTPPPAQPAYPAYGQPAQGYYAPPTNTLAIVALVLSFIVSLGGIICGHIALGQIKRTGEGGRGLAIAALIIGYVITAFFVIYIVIVIVALVWASSQAYNYY